MFCFQCEQSIKNGCIKSGVCGKSEDLSTIMDKIISSLIGLSKVLMSGDYEIKDTYFDLFIEGLFKTLTNTNFSEESLNKTYQEIVDTKYSIITNCLECSSPCSRFEDYDINLLWNDNEDVRSLKSLILFGLKGIAAYAYHARRLGYTDQVVNNYFLEALDLIGNEVSVSKLTEYVLKTGQINLKCMELLDKANSLKFGNPSPYKVPLKLEKGPFIIISGHDYYDLYELLVQTKDKNINIYTHSEMLPAFSYPLLREFKHLKGHFGTAWWNQQKEFENILGPILFTTNCLMPVKDSYKDRVYTTNVVGSSELIHLDNDYSKIINKALELKGYSSDLDLSGMNGGKFVETGYSHDFVIKNQDLLLQAIKSKKISHFFLIGGCDGSRKSRSYYTEFVKKTPKDSIILTLACGKYRFNDLELNSIDGLSRIMDIGQCNDSYSAIKIALFLSEALNVSVNELPLSIVLSWYEQKAVAVLLTLLSLGIKNIHIGPTLPQFISKNVLDLLVSEYGLTLINNPDEDLFKLLNK